MTKVCQNCSSLIIGRPNKVYCSHTCKKAVNNRNYTKSLKVVHTVQQIIKKNRRVLAHIYGLFGDEPIPVHLIHNSELDRSLYTSISAKEAQQGFLDYVLIRVSEQYYKIQKINTNVQF